MIRRFQSKFQRVERHYYCMHNPLDLSQMLRGLLSLYNLSESNQPKTMRNRTTD